jgi:hypothetical protein
MVTSKYRLWKREGNGEAVPARGTREEQRQALARDNCAIRVQRVCFLHIRRMAEWTSNMTAPCPI